MPKITLVQSAGDRQTMDIAAGGTLMQACKALNIAGIAAECGGAAACGTCMIIVESNWRDQLPAPTAIELSMLADEPKGTRLSCQIAVTDSIDGLIAVIPDRLY